VRVEFRVLEVALPEVEVELDGPLQAARIRINKPERAPANTPTLTVFERLTFFIIS
jgi:hypothetical protein